MRLGRDLARRGVAAVLAGALLGAQGCSTFREIPPTEYAARPSRDNVRVVTKDGRQWEFDSARVEGDSLKAFTRRDVEGNVDEYETHAFALSDVASLSARRIDWYRTGLIGGVSLAAVVAAGIAAHSHNNPTGGGGNPCPERNCGPQN